jgi:hypothetical protein
MGQKPLVSSDFDETLMSLLLKRIRVTTIELLKKTESLAAALTCGTPLSQISLGQ